MMPDAEKAEQELMPKSSGFAPMPNFQIDQLQATQQECEKRLLAKPNRGRSTAACCRTAD